MQCRSSMARYAAVLAAGLASYALGPLPRAAEAASDPTPVRTMRVDYFHTGNAAEERFSVDRIVLEPLPWPGHADRAIDHLRLGKYVFDVRDAASGELIYSRGFASIYGEWETTGEARSIDRTFHESLRFPRPAAPVEITLSKRDARNEFQPVWQLVVDPEDIYVDPSPPPRMAVTTLHDGGPPADSVDLLILGDGYTAAGCARDFLPRARQVTEALFRYAPFAQRREDVNVRAICPPAQETGVSRPSTGRHVRSPLGAAYDAFGSERYVLTYENRALRDIAAWAPYEFVQILVANETYGGGGIYGLYATAAAESDWLDYLFIHELGHHFAALADEYYVSPVAYEPTPITVEPWERNLTALLAPTLKWQHLATESVPIPTPWPKATYEEAARSRQAERQAIRDRRAPESEMSALFRRQQAEETALFGTAEHAHAVGAFEGASYEAKGHYRPQLDCVMFSRNDVPFCRVCQAAIEEVIDLYAGPAEAP